MGRADELDATLGDRPGRLRLQFGADLVDDDDLGHVVLDRLDHHLVLDRRGLHLHAARFADGRVRDIAVARDLVARVDDHDALAHVVGQHAGGLAQHRGLADARPTHDEDRLPALDEVVDDVDGAEHGPPDPARQAHDLPGPIPDRADAVERPLDACAVVVAEEPDVLDDVGDVGLVDLAVEQHDLRIREARLRSTSQVHDYLDECGPVRQGVDGGHDLGRERREERVEVVDRFAAVVWSHGVLH